MRTISIFGTSIVALAALAGGVIGCDSSNSDGVGGGGGAGSGGAPAVQSSSSGTDTETTTSSGPPPCSIGTAGSGELVCIPFEGAGGGRPDGVPGAGGSGGTGGSGGAGGAGGGSGGAGGSGGSGGSGGAGGANGVGGLGGGEELPLECPPGEEVREEIDAIEPFVMIVSETGELQDGQCCYYIFHSLCH